ncbi:hypothetical protein KVT40_005031 [Elsinoe batatas]|uniref:RING-type E3 ubiquitin transferase n=1 Tax=Elsinoe batatas TaxID=2601811 RepID=A0A8K0L896_9PEZI|nr:hypothetical protein KVT40_005031 [Elsinoe batatas]
MAVRSGSVVLPEWQDDSEVNACPICKRTFHFLFRKHHCRRCGRIICDQCSPHRITIPRQYIVRPPWESFRPHIITGDEEDLESSNPALGGGETVRVCNPCVPDPNYGPPPQQGDDISEGSRAHFNDGTTFTIPPYDYQQDSQRASTFHSPQRTSDRTYPERYRSTRDPTSPTRRAQEARVYYSRRSNSGSVPAHQVLDERFRQRAYRTRSDAPNQPYDPAAAEGGTPVPHGSRPIPGIVLARGARPQTRVPSGSAPPAYTRIFEQTGPSWEQSPSRPRPTGRRQVPVQVREEDECPVCGTHDPPFGASGDQELRERHIEECISSHLQFSSPSRSTPVQVPDIAESSTQTAQSSGDVTSEQLPGPGSFIAARLPFLAPFSSSPASSSTNVPPQSPVGTPQRSGSVRTRPRGHTNQQRMLVYHATEKDCFDEAGNAQECIICFEDFGVGEDMGRLECLCKFHRKCIRGWWQSVGQPGVPGARWGSCPTHTLQTY